MITERPVSNRLGVKRSSSFRFLFAAKFVVFSNLSKLRGSLDLPDGRLGSFVFDLSRGGA